MGTHEILTLVSLAGTIVMAIITTLARTAEAEKERRLLALEKQDASCLQKQEAHSERLRLDELATERLGGRMALAEQKAGQHSEQLGRTVSQQEFERAMEGVTKALDKIAERLERFDRSGRSGGYSQVNPGESKR